MVAERCRRCPALSLRLSAGSSSEPVPSSGTGLRSPCSETEAGRAHPLGMSRVGHVPKAEWLAHERREPEGLCSGRG